MKHYILTRYCLNVFSDNVHGIKDIDKWMEDRFELFQQTKQSVVSQRKDFDVTWFLCFDSLTPQYWIDKVCTEDWMIPTFKRPPAITYPEGWKITTRLDSDDLLLNGFFEAVHNVATEGEEQLIDVKYMHGGTMDTRRFCNSMFISLVNNNQFKSVCDGEHSNMHKKYKGHKIQQVLAKHRKHGGNLFKKQGNNWNK